MIPVGYAKYKPGDWVADERNTYRPMIGRVSEVMWDTFDGCWCICIHVYSPAGNRGKFEPMLPEAHWAKVKRPSFPLKQGRYDDWGAELEYVEEEA